jgi:hypothetical protein
MFLGNDGCPSRAVVLDDLRQMLGRAAQRTDSGRGKFLLAFGRSEILIDRLDELHDEGVRRLGLRHDCDPRRSDEVHTAFACRRNVRQKRNALVAGHRQQ